MVAIYRRLSATALDAMRDASCGGFSYSRPALAALSVLGAGLLLGACSSLPGIDMASTGSLAPRAVSYASEPVPKGIAPDDWAAARVALAEALGEKQTAPSVPWENYASSTRGTVTPLGDVSSEARGKCREFLMSFVKDSGESWLQGEACRASLKAGWKVDQARLLERA